MPNFTERSYVERIVIAFNEDGSFRGAHQERHELTLKDGEEIARTPKIEPVDAGAVTDLLPDHATALEQVSNLIANEKKLTAELGAHKEELPRLRNAAADALAALADEKKRHAAAVEAHKVQMKQARQEVDRARTRSKAEKAPTVRA